MTEEEKKKDEEEHLEDRGIVVFPYVKSFSERLKKITWKHNCRVAHTRRRKIKGNEIMESDPFGKKAERSHLSHTLWV